MMKKTVLVSVFMLLACCAVFSVERSVAPLSYSSALAEYYSLYCTGIGDRQIEESYILLFPKEYVVNDKDEVKRSEDQKKVKESLAKSIREINKGNHEYNIMLKGQLGDYDKGSKGFNCVFLSSWSCIDIGPLSKEVNPSPEAAEVQSIIARGVLFNKINKIKLFFSNTEDFNFLKYPEDKAKILLKNGPNPAGSYEVVLMMDVEILRGTEKSNRRKLDNILRNINLRTEESNYFMIAKIKSIEVYGDFALVNNLGKVTCREKKMVN